MIQTHASQNSPGAR
jgi:hypothetical protein